MSAVVLVAGDGILTDYVCRELSADCHVVRRTELTAEVPQRTALALVLDDAWQPARHNQAEEVFQTTGTPWLRAFAAFGEGVVGPLVYPGTPGCSQCADLRFLMADAHRNELMALEGWLAEHGGARRDPWASHTGLSQLAHLCVAEARRVLEGSAPLLEGHVYLLNLKTLRASRHAFLPDGTCPVCAQLPQDTSDGACLTLSPSPKLSADSYRCRSTADLKDVLVNDYLDVRTGLLNREVHDLTSTFAGVSVNLPLLQGDEATAGRTLSYAEGKLTAILEGLERYCGLQPRGKRTMIHDSYRRLGEQALNPLTVGVHDRKQYARPDFPFKPFDPDDSMPWVWGYSLLHERPLLVPELLAYYSLGGGDGFVYETSNGCALGGSLVEAILHGIFEVVERDSFLMTWYAQLPVPRIDLRSVDDRELQLMMERLQAVAGFELHLFNATMENGIPSVWALAKNRKQRGINLFCAAGAHLDPVRAAKSAIHELAGGLFTLDEQFEANKDVYLEMYRHPYKVQQMEDHSMLYGLPQAEERLSFLLHSKTPVQTFTEAFKLRPHHLDLTAELKAVLAAFHRLQLDVIVVDQTAPELRRNGLYCVKVLIPGMLPMTFGYHLTRLEGLHRVLRVPVTLGYAKKPLKRNQLNPHPHPFP